MVEPVSIGLGVLLSGFASILWNEANSGLAQQAVAGVVGNEAHDKMRRLGGAVRARLLNQRGRLSRNHDIAMALRRAQLNAIEHVVETWARSKRLDANLPKTFLENFRSGLSEAKAAVDRLGWDEATETTMFASYQQAFRNLHEASDPVADRARLDEQVVDLAWAEVGDWAGKAHVPQVLEPRFRGETEGLLGFLAAWRGEVVAEIKKTPEFETAFFSGKLVEISEGVIEGGAALARLEESTEGVRERLADLRDWLDEQFEGLHGRHDRHDADMAEMKAMLAALTKRESGEVEVGAEAQERRSEAAGEIIRGDEAEQAAARLIADGRVAEGFARLKADAAGADREAAVKWRRLGDLAYGVSVVEARDAYARAVERDPDDHWTHVLLAQLHMATGDLSAARGAAEAAAKSAKHDRDQMVASAALGDVAVAQGDLEGAWSAYKAGLDIARELSALDPGDTLRRRDLSVSHNRLGDVAVAQGDLDGARSAYQAGLDIARELSALDPGNTQWRRDLSVSHDRLGDVAKAQGDLEGPRSAYQAGLDIRRELSARDPGNTEWRRDLSVSHNKLGDVAKAEGDLEGARTAYQAGLDITRDLSAHDPGNVEWRRDLAVSYAKLAQLAEASGDKVRAIVNFRAAEADFQAVLALSPTHSETRRMADAARANIERLARPD